MLVKELAEMLKTLDQDRTIVMLTSEGEETIDSSDDINLWNDGKYVMCTHYCSYDKER